MRIPEGGEQTFGLLETDTPKAPVAVGRTLREHSGGREWEGEKPGVNILLFKNVDDPLVYHRRSESSSSSPGGNSPPEHSRTPGEVPRAQVQGLGAPSRLQGCTTERATPSSSAGPSSLFSSDAPVPSFPGRG